LNLLVFNGVIFQKFHMKTELHVARYLRCPIQLAICATGVSCSRIGR
jgi:hypothetical protein